MPCSRRQSVQTALGAAIGLATGQLDFAARAFWVAEKSIESDVAIIGGGLGGCAAALACLRNGLSVTLTEETSWIGGQITSQGVPPDEHSFIETHGANLSYRRFRDNIRQHYRQHYRLTDRARQDLRFNPGRGSVSKLCCEPQVAVIVLEQMLAPYIHSGQLTLLKHTRAVSADTAADRVLSVIVTCGDQAGTWNLVSPYFIDATELGDLLPLCGTEFTVGSESRNVTGEPHASDAARPDNQQAFTICFAIDYQPHQNHTIPRPDQYEYWRDLTPILTPPWPGKLLQLSYSNPRTLEPKSLGFDPTGAPTAGRLNLWSYRRIVDHRQFLPEEFSADVSLVNWPQNDFFFGNLVGVSPEERLRNIDRAKQLSLSCLYWLQTEVDRPDGGNGYPGLRLCPEIMGTPDGLAMHPYIRESRRIQAEFTVLEQHVSRQCLMESNSSASARRVAQNYYDSVGVGSYPIDLHPSSGGDNYIDFETLPFQIPLGSLLPQRVENLLPACKNIGTTHLTSGCYRLHPVEWGIGEATGCLIAYSIKRRTLPRAIRADQSQLEQFQNWIRGQGVETAWPD